MKLYTLIAAATILGLFIAILCPRCGQAWFGRWWRRKTELRQDLYGVWHEYDGEAVGV